MKGKGEGGGQGITEKGRRKDENNNLTHMGVARGLEGTACPQEASTLPFHDGTTVTDVELQCRGAHGTSTVSP